MFIKSLKLVHFRNYEEICINFKNGVNFIVGQNGEGKTNILEAIYLLSIGKSFRTNKDKEMIKFENTNTYVGGIFLKNEKENSIEISMGKDLKKGIKINKINIDKFSKLLGNLNAVLFSPEDLKLVKDGPKERRKFIDREICQVSPKYYHYLSNYNKILIQRNTLLKSKHIDETLLDIYDEELSVYGSYIYMQRKNFVDKINKISNKIHFNLTNGKENLTIEYDSQVEIKNDYTDKIIKKQILKLLKLSRTSDIQNRNTKYGPHKDDLQIYINSLNVRAYGSQGQQRTGSISIKLSQIEFIKNETGENPIVLLDDIFSELDENRQDMLIDNLDGLQVFVTSAEQAHKFIFKDKNAQIYNVKQGNIELQVQDLK